MEKKLELTIIMKLDGKVINNLTEEFKISKQLEEIHGVNIEELESIDEILEVRDLILEHIENINILLPQRQNAINSK